MAATHKGECFCGAVRVEVSGEPEAMGYCHCQSCRSWSGGPVNAFTLWKPEAVRSLRVRNMLLCSKRQKSVSDNTAKNAVDTLWPIILHWDWWTYLQRRYRH